MLVSLRLAPHANLPARWTAFKNTLTLAPVGTGVMPLAACPRACWLALRCPPRWRLFLLVLVIVPFWTSLLIRTYAWIFILGGRGLPALLGWLGWASPT
jgi:spermidine/putrescine transport system permease protein